MKKIITTLFIVLFIGAFANATVHSITVQDFQFNPANINVQVGDTVKWVWDVNGSPHTTTSTTIPAGATPWDQQIDMNHLSYSYKVTVPGNYTYICTIHTSMVGHITATGTSGTTDFNNRQSLILNNIASGNLNATYNLIKTTKVDINILDINGKDIRKLVSVVKTPGSYTENWKVNDLPKGMYFIEMKTIDGIETKKVLLQ